jgi:hypothetical protein
MIAPKQLGGFVGIAYQYFMISLIRCPVFECTLEWKVLGRFLFSADDESIESHVFPPEM